jgi:hypothetical protein
MKHADDPTRRANEPGYGTSAAACGPFIGHPRPRNFIVDLTEAVEAVGGILPSMDQNRRMDAEEQAFYDACNAFLGVVTKRKQAL